VGGCFAKPGKSKRRNLKIRHPEKYQWHPLELLRQLVSIFLNLARADRSRAFVRAVASDTRSYNAELFEETANVSPAVADGWRLGWLRASGSCSWLPNRDQISYFASQ
jgi:Ubiquitin elongating factor core